LIRKKIGWPGGLDLNCVKIKRLSLSENKAYPKAQLLTPRF
jgi:hypothetical protein